MDSKSVVYYIGVVFVAAATFFFIIYILPSLDPLVGVIILTGMLSLMSVGYALRIQRMRMVSKESRTQEQDQTDMTTEDYIQQIEEIMGKKKL
ncbi:MAG: hypothetical protein ACXADY_12400 [Candidatus Hodarchaeales archaeon]|jgi:hypothetical protein